MLAEMFFVLAMTKMHGEYFSNYWKECLVRAPMLAICILFAMGSSAIIITSASAEDLPWRQIQSDHNNKGEQSRRSEERKSSIFSEVEKNVIKEFFAESSESKPKKSKQKYTKGKSKKFPPGLAKKESLPPGLARQLERNGALPPGLQKRSLPSDLNAKLSKLPKGIARLLVGNDVILTEEDTGLILDILRNVVPGE